MTLRVLGTDIAIGSEDDHVTELLRILWAPLLVDAPRSPDVVVRVSSQEGRVGVVREPPGGGSFDNWEGEADDLWALMLTIRYAIGEIAVELAGEGVVIHAAVAAKNDGAVLLVGPNGVGKTTLVLEMLRRGWAYLSDDLAPIGPEGSVLPFPKPLGIRGDPGRWAELLPLWRPPDWVPEPVGAFLIPAGIFEVADRPIRPHAIFFPTYAPDAAPEGTFEEMSTARALSDVGEQTSRIDPGSLRALSSLLQGLPTYRVRYSSAPGVLPGLEVRTL